MMNSCIIIIKYFMAIKNVTLKTRNKKKKLTIGTIFLAINPV